MRKFISQKFQASLPGWARSDARYARLDELDRLLAGTFYDHFNYCYYQMNDGDREIPILDRRPSVVLNIYGMIADQIARKLFAGQHAPVLSHPDPNVALQLQELREEAELDSLMIEAATWASVGSAAVTFKVLPTAGGRGKAVTELYRSKYCQPMFDATKELRRLRVAYLMSGTDAMLRNWVVDVEGKDLKADTSYWYVVDHTPDAEIYYLPIKDFQWEPKEVNSPRLVEDVSKTVRHGLGFVPAQWLQNRRGCHNDYDGVCYWERAVPLIIDADYSISQMGVGLRYNAAPQVVIKGNPVSLMDQYTGNVSRSPSRYLQFEAGTKDPDGVSYEAGDAKLLEMEGKGLEIGIEYYVKTILHMALKLICGSVKDPNKITTAMSALAIELIEQEFLDLFQELRTNFGQNGFLKLLKKMAIASMKAKHPVVKGLSLEQIDALTLAWPPVVPIGAGELQQMTAGLAQAVLVDILKKEQATAYVTAHMDLPTESANRDFTPETKAPEPGEAAPEERPPAAAETGEQLGMDGLLSAAAAVTGDTLETSFGVDGR